MSDFTHNSTYNKKEVEVLAGWDPMLLRFFMVVTYVNEEDFIQSDNFEDQEGIVYSNLSDVELAYIDDDELDYFAQKLNHYGIKVPDDFFSQVRESQKQHSNS